MSVDSQVKVLESVVERIDTSIEKLTEVSNSIGKLLAVHDERINNLEKSTTRQEDDIRDIHFRINKVSTDICTKLDSMEDSLEAKIKEHSETSERLHKELKYELETDLKSLNTRLEVLEKWRWLLLGGAAVIGYIINKVTNLF
jgi:DNA repair exonuclease SbcCD ATPase subunit